MGLGYANIPFQVTTSFFALLFILTTAKDYFLINTVVAEATLRLNGANLLPPGEASLSTL
jgi:hypothetical protein